jgi:type II secretory pathway component PulK
MALIAAIGMLMIFAMLGTAYIGYTTIEYDEAGIHLQELRAKRLAASGVEAAIAEMQAAIARGETPKPEYTMSLAAYRQEATGLGVYPQPVKINVIDESSRVNLNFAPEPLLRAMGLPENAAKAVADYRAAGKKLASVASLRADGLLDGQAYQAIDASLFTVYTGTDPRQPHSYLNLNTVPEKVLAAIFSINADEAKALAGKRPFTSWADALQKVGREPGTFNVSAPQYAVRDMPRDLALVSRCFRLVSTVAMDMPGGTGRIASAGVEVVVVFPENGGRAVRYWQELNSGTAEEKAAAAQEPAQ